MGNAVVKSNQVGVSSQSPPEIHQEENIQEKENYIPHSQEEKSDDNISEADEKEDSVPSKPSGMGFKKGFSMKSKMISGIGTLGSDGDDDSDAIDILFELIPYHGQGDGSNDTIFRSALSAASVEDIDRRDSFGNTLLLSSCQYHLEAVVRILLNKGADPNAANSAGASCLHFACYKVSLSKNIAKLLLQNGANPDVQELTYGCTPLHYAASSGDFDLCKTLISFGAEVKTLDYYEYTCSDYAREGGFAELATYLQTKLLMVTSHQNLSHFATTNNDPGSSSSPPAAGAASIHHTNQLNSDLVPGSDSLTTKPSSLTAQLSILPHSSSSSIITPTVDHDQHQLRNLFLPEPSPRIGDCYGSASPPSPPHSAAAGGGAGGGADAVSDECWVAQIDISTNEKYFMNMETGECLWEADYLQHLEALQSNKSKSKTQTITDPPDKEKETQNKTLTHGATFSSPQKLQKLMGTSAHSSFRLSSTALGGSPGAGAGESVSVLREEIFHLKNRIQEIQLLSEQRIEKNQNEFRHQLLEKEMKLVQLDTTLQQTLRENERLEVCCSSLSFSLSPSLGFPSLILFLLF
jgi:hypothetical protein